MDDTGDERSRMRSSGRLIVAIALAAGVLVLASLAGPSVDLSKGEGCEFGSDCVTTVATDGGTEEGLTFGLEITVNGVGEVKQETLSRCKTTSGTNTSSKACTVTYGQDAMPVLTAIAASGYSFTGWQGACSGTGTCQPTMDGNKAVTANFVDSTPPGAPGIGGATSSTVWRSDEQGPLLTITRGAEAVTKLDCRVDTATWADCSSSTWRPSATGLATGIRNLTARSYDVNGNFADGSVGVKFVVIPNTTLTGAPPAFTSSSHTAFTYGPAGSPMKCQLNVGPDRPCTSDIETAGLADGPYTLTVAAGTNVPGSSSTEYDKTPATATWRVDTQAPNTTITSLHPTETDLPSSRFEFSGTDPAPGTALTYECKLDGAPAFTPCSSGTTYNGLAAGTHTFSVRAKDAAANVDPTPATKTWKVVLVDNDGDGFHPSDSPPDCRDDNASVHPGALDVPDDGVDQNCDGADAINWDRDGDGVLRRPAGGDCDDTTSAIRPGALDRPEDGINQDCSGGDAKWKAPPISGGFAWAMDGNATLVIKAVWTGAPGGSKAELRCSGRGCPFTKKRLVFKNGKLNATKLVKTVRLRKGAVLQMRASSPNTMTKIWRVVSRAPKSPITEPLCLKPGAKRPGACS